jgi:16S rRNA (adenine1518-N6/adenine1519-N6)-dimethyltransferase
MTRTAPARKRFGQHFLAPEWVAKVVAAIDPQPEDTLIEVGPGHGALTFALAARAREVIAFEIDRDLVRELRSTMPVNVTIIEGDFLETADRLRTGDSGSVTGDWRLATDGLPRSLRLAANLPYNVASPILFKLVSLYAQGVPLADATVMLQREVADRLIAEPGGKEYGVLSVLIQHAADVRRVLALPPGAFRPPPKVRSAVVNLKFHPARPPVSSPRVFAAVVQAVFTRRRKTVANALTACAGLESVRGGGAAKALGRAGIDGRRRPETLSVAEFARLADAVTASLPCPP